MMDIKSKLQELDLTETESKIYLALLRLGQSTAVDLSKEMSVHRRTIYDNLNILIKKGLANYVMKDNVKYFEAANPVTLQTMLEEKEKTLSSIMPELQKLYKEKEDGVQANVYVGVEGAKSIIEEALQEGGTLYWVGGGLIFFENLGFSKKFVKDKLSQADIKMVQAKSEKMDEKLDIFDRDDVRIISEKYSSNVGYLIYDDTVAIGLIQEDITIIKVKNENFARGFKNYFDIMWETGDSIS